MVVAQLSSREVAGSNLAGCFAFCSSSFVDAVSSIITEIQSTTDLVLRKNQ